MLASSALATARQAVDASTKWFRQVGAYQSLHVHLAQQSLRHVGDDETMVDVCDLLHCQLQAGGRLSSPDSDGQEPLHDIDSLLEHFDDIPTGDCHMKPFIQDGGDDDRYYE